MTSPWSVVSSRIPLDPSPDRARTLLRDELRHAAYQQNPMNAFLHWLNDRLSSALQVTSHASPLSAAVGIALFAGLVVLIIWLLSRFRRTVRATTAASGAVLTDEVVTASDLRVRAEAALASGDPAAALVDAFRALTVRQIERGRLDDLPGATAHEVAAGLGFTFPLHGPRVRTSADLFDLVLYGDRPASPDQAAGVLALDDELAKA